MIKIVLILSFLVIFFLVLGMIGQLDDIQERDDRINRAIKYIEENNLYEQDYDYDYEENLVEYPPSDEKAKRSLLNILRGDKNEHDV